jgi:hypothetical protein
MSPNTSADRSDSDDPHAPRSHMFGTGIVAARGVRGAADVAGRQAPAIIGDRPGVRCRPHESSARCGATVLPGVGGCGVTVGPVPILDEARSAYPARLCILPLASDGTGRPDVLDATNPARRSPDLTIADLLSELHLTAEAVRDITPDVLDGRLRALAVTLTGADRLRRALVAAELKRTAKLPAAIVSAALETRDHEPDKTTRDTIALTDDEPAPEPVPGATLLDETAALIRRHVVLTEAQADACALWNGAAHAIDGLQRMPMLLVSSNAPECGKTTAATLLSGLVPRPVMVSNLTPAVLFRLLDRYQPTLIADEVDSWLNDEQSELRGVFNAAHWRTGALIPRCVGDDHDVRLFNVFGAKVLAMIGRPSATLLSRSITITLHRKTAGERVEPLREDRLRADLGALRQQWRRWAVDHLGALRVHDPAMPAGLPVNRASDNWRPLLSIADLAGGSWPARARAAAIELSGVRVSEDEPDNVALLVDVQAVFRERGQPEYCHQRRSSARSKRVLSARGLTGTRDGASVRRSSPIACAASVWGRGASGLGRLVSTPPQRRSAGTGRTLPTRGPGM